MSWCHSSALCPLCRLFNNGSEKERIRSRNYSVLFDPKGGVIDTHSSIQSLPCCCMSLSYVLSRQLESETIQVAEELVEAAPGKNCCDVRPAGGRRCCSFGCPGEADGCCCCCCSSWGGARLLAEALLLLSWESLKSVVETLPSADLGGVDPGVDPPPRLDPPSFLSER